MEYYANFEKDETDLPILIRNSPKYIFMVKHTNIHKLLLKTVKCLPV